MTSSIRPTTNVIMTDYSKVEHNPEVRKDKLASLQKKRIGLIVAAVIVAIALTAIAIATGGIGLLAMGGSVAAISAVVSATAGPAILGAAFAAGGLLFGSTLVFGLSGKALNDEIKSNEKYAEMSVNVSRYNGSGDWTPKQKKDLFKKLVKDFDLRFVGSQTGDLLSKKKTDNIIEKASANDLAKFFDVMLDNVPEDFRSELFERVYHNSFDIAF